MPGHWIGRRSRTVATLACLLAAPAVWSSVPAAETLERIVDDYYEQYLELNPNVATFIGDDRFNDRLAIDISPEHRRRSLQLEEQALAAARALPSESLDAKDRLTLELFIHGRRQAVAAHAFPEHLLPVDQLQSLPIVLAIAGGGSSIQPFATVDDYGNWLERLETWPAWVEQALVNMRQGLARRIVQPRPVVERILPLLASQVVDDPERSVFFDPVRRMPASFPSEDRRRIERAYRSAIEEQIVPGYRRLLEFMENSYLPRARETIGLSALPDGSEWYLFLVRAHTTTDLTPEEIHQLGRREVARISAKIARLGRNSGSVPRSRSRGTRRLLDGYRALRSRIEPKLPRLFLSLPMAELEIRSVEPFRRASAPGASYLAGLPDGSRPGRFYVNADEKTIGEPSEALFLHEAIPGHHFQISLQRQRQDLPRFRRFGSITAFVEGWALYAESLGEQLGLLREPEQKLRALRSELFRARRLVVDTGIHHFGWSREQAIDYLGSTREVDRYIAWPGQALAYKAGEVRIQQLRRQAEKRLGRRFDLRHFHDMVLREGPLPLDILERRILAWIDVESEAR